ncbi:hypothetical protein ACFSC4_20780 [Deinococcus malanensis]|uniref:hypothetical protein n=1 Tax=Deinococcus malanensis TaxID=1706855 RepID=UPI003645DF78
MCVQVVVGLACGEDEAGVVELGVKAEVAALAEGGGVDGLGKEVAVGGNAEVEGAAATVGAGSADDEGFDSCWAGEGECVAAAWVGWGWSRSMGPEGV